MSERQGRNLPVTNSIKDPYIGFNEQEEDIKKYKYRTGNLVFFIWILVILLAGLFFVFLLKGDGCLRLLFGLIFISTSLYSLLNLPSSFLCTPDQIVIFYYLRPSIKIYWIDIFELNIKWRRGVFGHISGLTSSIRFPLNKLNGLDNQPLLLSTIVARANLNFIEGYVGDKVIYRKG